METLMKMKWKIGSVEIENPFILPPAPCREYGMEDP